MPFLPWIRSAINSATVPGLTWWLEPGNVASGQVLIRHRTACRNDAAQEPSSTCAGNTPSLLGLVADVAGGHKRLVTGHITVAEPRGRGPTGATDAPATENQRATRERRHGPARWRRIRRPVGDTRIDVQFIICIQGEGPKASGRPCVCVDRAGLRSCQSEGPASPWRPPIDRTLAGAVSTGDPPFCSGTPQGTRAGRPWLPEYLLVGCSMRLGRRVANGRPDQRPSITPPL